MQFGEIADICLIRMKFEIYQGLCFCQKTKYQPITDLLRLYAKSQKYRYRNLISQVFEGSKLLVLVGDTCNALLGSNIMFQSYDHISRFLPFFTIAMSLGHLFHRIASIYDRFYLPRLNKLFEEN